MKSTGSIVFSLKHVEKAMVLLCFGSKTVKKTMVLLCFRSTMLKKQWLYKLRDREVEQTNGFTIKTQKRGKNTYASENPTVLQVTNISEENT